MKTDKPFKRYLLALMLLVSLTSQLNAQCTFKNTAFKSGEFLYYNLYYNWKFVWVKAGSASMSTVMSRYKGKPAYRTSLTTRGNNKVDEMFVLRDTLLAYVSDGLAPLYYRKGAREGKRYYVDEVFYSYDGNNVNLRQHELHASGNHTWKNTTSNECMYDMVSSFLRARNYDPTGWNKGQVIKIPIADGDDTKTALLKYRGKSNIKADNGVKYRCLVLSYMEKEEGQKDYKEIVRFYVTDDSNHIPVRLDMFLRFGSAKAFLVSMKGNKNSVTAVVK